MIARFGVSIDKIIELLDKYVGPKVGDLRYLAVAYPDTNLVRQPDGTYMPTADFDGWAYPRSSIVLRKSVFPEAFELYGVSGRSTFNLPEIRNVPLRMIGNLTSSNPGILDIIKQIKVPPHKHTIGKVGVSRITLKNGLSYISSSGNNESSVESNHYETRNIGTVSNVRLPRFHNGSYSSTSSRPTPLDINMTIADSELLFGTGAETEFTGATNEEATFTLKHLTMPIMVYIGKPHINTTGPFTVNFFTDDTYSTLITTLSVAKGASAIAPANPTKTGLDFLRWNAAFNNVTTDLDIYAIWDVSKYTVVWNASGGSGVADWTNIAHGTKLGSLPSTTYAGKAFLGWFTAANVLVDDNTCITSNMTFYAHWENASRNVQINIYDVGNSSNKNADYTATLITNNAVHSITKSETSIVTNGKLQTLEFTATNYIVVVTSPGNSVKPFSGQNWTSDILTTYSKLNSFNLGNDVDITTIDIYKFVNGTTFTYSGTSHSTTTLRTFQYFPLGFKFYCDCRSPSTKAKPLTVKIGHLGGKSKHVMHVSMQLSKSSGAGTTELFTGTTLDVTGMSKTSSTFSIASTLKSAYKGTGDNANYLYFDLSGKTTPYKLGISVKDNSSGCAGISMSAKFKIMSITK